MATNFSMTPPWSAGSGTDLDWPTSLFGACPRTLIWCRRAGRGPAGRPRTCAPPCPRDRSRYACRPEAVAGVDGPEHTVVALRRLHRLAHLLLVGAARPLDRVGGEHHAVVAIAHHVVRLV